MMTDRLPHLPSAFEGFNIGALDERKELRGPSAERSSRLEAAQFTPSKVMPQWMQGQLFFHSEKRDVGELKLELGLNEKATVTCHGLFLLPPTFL
jgi:hypothetical protein